MSADTTADDAARVASRDNHKDATVVETREVTIEVNGAVASDASAKAEGRTCALCAAKKPIAGGACGSIGGGGDHGGRANRA